MTPSKTRLLVAAAAVCALVALGGTTAIAAETRPEAATVFHACLKDGTLSSVATKAVTCASGFQAVSWDKSGPQGPMGMTGIKSSSLTTS